VGLGNETAGGKKFVKKRKNVAKYAPRIGGRGESRLWKREGQPGGGERAGGTFIGGRKSQKGWEETKSDRHRGKVVLLFPEKTLQGGRTRFWGGGVANNKGNS